MNAKQSSVFTLLVDNEFGVLTRITALIRRAGWNIRSLAVAETAKPEVSRLTICLECRHNTLEQVLEKLERLDCVRSVVVFSDGDQVARELALLHLRGGDCDGIHELCARYGAQVVEQDGDKHILALTCAPDELDALMPRLLELGLVDIARTGAISLMREIQEDTLNG